MKVKHQESALEEILKGLEEEGEKEKKKILAEAEKEAKKIIAEARKAAKEAYDSIIKEKTSQFKAQATNIIKEAELKAEKEVAQAKASILQEIFSAAQQKILKERYSDRYRNALHRLLIECLNEIGFRSQRSLTTKEEVASLLEELFKGKITKEESVLAAEKILENRGLYDDFLRLIKENIKAEVPLLKIICSPDDVDLVREIVALENINAEIKADKGISGGLIVATVDEKIVVNNTLETRIEKLKRLHAKELIEEFIRE